MRKYSGLKDADAPSLFYSLPELHYPEMLNAVKELLEPCIEKGWQARDAYFYQGRRISYEEVRRNVHRYGQALISLGVAAGDAVILRIEDGPELVYAILAIQAIGAIAVPTYVQLRSDGLVTRIVDCGAKAALVSNTLREEFEGVPGQCPALHHVVMIPEDPTGRFKSLRDCLPTNAPEIAYAQTNRDDVALILYTSGSTGQPKGTLHSHADLLAICDTYARYSVGLRNDDIVAGPPSIPFALGVGFFIYFPLRFGASAVLDNDKSPDALARSIENFGVTILMGVSTYFGRFSQLIVEKKLTFSSLRMALCGGEPLPVEINRAWTEATGLVLEQFLGTTELLHIFIGIRHGLDTPKADAIGIPVPGYEISLRDPETFTAVGPGERGLLCVRGATGTRYLNRPQAQAETVREGWNVFPDIVYADRDGFIHYIARNDDIIVSAGHSISPVEVEQFLLAHPNVVECACVAGRDRHGERPSVVTAFVVLKDGISRTDETKTSLKEFFKKAAPPYMYPREIEFMDSLPRTMNGKILRTELRRIANV